MSKINWLPEDAAAKKLGYNSAVWFRRLVKSGALKIAYTSVRGRAYQYSEKDLDKLLMANSTV